MRSLFLRIFLSYWLAQALFLVLAILVTWAMHQESNTEARQTRVLTDAVRSYESGGAQEARRYLQDAQELQHVRLYLFDEQGNELTGRSIPDWAKDGYQGKFPPPRDFLDRFTPRPFDRQSLTAASGRSYTLIMLMPSRGPLGSRNFRWLGILIGVVSSGVVCFFLARYLTAPIVRLRAATQKLAAGDLSARAGTPQSEHRDEMGGLVRDFDTMAERLENMVNAQSRLLKDISHELRSPLARLNVALALAQQRANPEAQGSLERIDLESDRLNELIGRLLTVARLESGEDGTRKIQLQLGSLVQEIAEDANFEAQSRDCHVRAIIVNDCHVLGNPALLHSAIENVVRNATRYTRDGTDVQVSLRQEMAAGAPVALIQVVDSGPGVPEEALDKLFLPFYRIDDSRGRQTGGVGLGLAITERAVRLHGGSVKAQNRPEGGLLVEIRLPQAKQEIPDVSEPETVPAESGPVSS